MKCTASIGMADSMRFAPGAIVVKRGDTLRIVARKSLGGNVGLLDDAPGAVHQGRTRRPAASQGRALTLRAAMPPCASV